MVAVPDSHSLALFAGSGDRAPADPRPAVLYIVAQSAQHGRLAGLVSVAGVHLGTLVHVAAAAVGLSAIIVSSAIAFSVVKYAGAAYLDLSSAIRRLLDPRALPSSLAPRDAPLAGLFSAGRHRERAEPEDGALLPRVPAAVRRPRPRTVWPQVLVLGLTFVVLGFVSDGLYAVTAGTLARWLKQRRRLLRYASGSVFVGLGVSAALAKRS